MKKNKKSFKLESRDIKDISARSWVYYALIFIPIGILISIVILLVAFNLKANFAGY